MRSDAPRCLFVGAEIVMMSVGCIRHVVRLRDNLQLNWLSRVVVVVRMADEDVSRD